MKLTCGGICLQDKNICPEKLNYVLSKKFGADITAADYKTERLHGGTLGDVWLVAGDAICSDRTILPYKVVYKTQKKWQRYGDPLSWRREYDLYAALPDAAFTGGSLCRPKCYHAELDEGEVRLWIEFAEGVSGANLTPDMYERAARVLGRFQGMLYARGHDMLCGVTNLSAPDYMKNFYLNYRSWGEVYDYIRADSCPLPAHLREMLIECDEQSKAIFERLEKLPLVFCHRDFWAANISCSRGEILLIDWDTAGWGYMGEDIANLIADESDIEHMVENFSRCVPAYNGGFTEYSETPPVTEKSVYEMMLLKFGYRLVEWYKFADTDESREEAHRTLHKIYEIGRICSDTR
jgi:hypothetical protein